MAEIVTDIKLQRMAALQEVQELIDSPGWERLKRAMEVKIDAKEKALRKGDPERSGIIGRMQGFIEGVEWAIKHPITLQNNIKAAETEDL